MTLSLSDPFVLAALMLNIIVALITTLGFYWAGHFSWPIFWPFAFASIPFAFLGGALSVSSSLYRVLQRSGQVPWLSVASPALSWALASLPT